MISFDDFTPESGSPLYWQILRHIKRGIVAGRIVDGDELPSRRMLSALLGINPNTVQKAYKMLEEEGLVLSHPGAKSLIVLKKETIQRIRNELLKAETLSIIGAFRQMGVSKEEALSLIALYWQ